MVNRRLPDVLKEHDGTVKVLHTLRPFAVAMGQASSTLQGLRVAFAPTLFRSSRFVESDGVQLALVAQRMRAAVF